MSGTQEVEVDCVFKHECGPDAQCVFSGVSYKRRCTLKGKWCFWDETYAIHGPFESEHEARLVLLEYCHVELGPGLGSLR